MRNCNMLLKSWNAHQKAAKRWQQDRVKALLHRRGYKSPKVTYEKDQTNTEISTEA